MIFRTNLQKQDQALSWMRGDRAFFASGACHVLACVFLREYTDIGYEPYMIVPGYGFRGSHVFAATEDTVFDYHGFSHRGFYLDHYFQKIRRFYPGWNATIIKPNDFMKGSFLRKYKMRALDQYYADPLPRAMAYVAQKCLRQAVE
jgi:hypothetical protein